MTIFVQFSDEACTKIISCFVGPQDASSWSNLGEVEASDPRWRIFYEQMTDASKPFWPPPENEAAALGRGD